MNKIVEVINELIGKGFPGRKGTGSFIVDSSNPLTTNIRPGFSIEVMEDVSGLTIVDTSLSGGGSYPTELTAGYITYGNFTEISVTSGILKVYFV